MPISRWMVWLLRFAGTFNLLAGAGMMVLYHEGFKLFGLPKPELSLPIQVMGSLVALFGVGYHLVASHPLDNRNILMLGFWSKAFGSLFSILCVVKGQLPPWFLVVVFFADMIYLLPFHIILRRIDRELQAEQDAP